jgi:putative oxidoreductase
VNAVLHAPAVALLARALLVCMFPFSAIDKMLHWGAALRQANSSFLPGGPVLLVLAIAVEVGAPLAIVLGWYALLAALVLMAFCLATALLYHPFWNQGDFWARGDSSARSQFWDFTKNLGLAGGLLLVALNAASTGAFP